MDLNQESETSVSSSDDDSDFGDDTEDDLATEEESDVVEYEDEEFEWHWGGNFVRSTNFSSHVTEGRTTIPVTEKSDPIDIFDKFFTKDIINLIVMQTNVYGKKKSLARGSSNEWQEVNENSIRSFLGLLIIMGLHRVPQFRDYRSRNKILYTEVVANVMSRNEFYRLFSALHLSDDKKQSLLSKTSKEYKLFKVFDLMRLLKRNFQENYVLGTNVCIDESMIKFKGRSSLNQYLPSKPIKRG